MGISCEWFALTKWLKSRGEFEGVKFCREAIKDNKVAFCLQWSIVIKCIKTNCDRIWQFAPQIYLELLVPSESRDYKQGNGIWMNFMWCSILSWWFLYILYGSCKLYKPLTTLTFARIDPFSHSLWHLLCDMHNDLARVISESLDCQLYFHSHAAHENNYMALWLVSLADSCNKYCMVLWHD